MRERSAAVAQLVERWETLTASASQQVAASLPPAGEPIVVKGLGRMRALPLRCIPKDQDEVFLAYRSMLVANCFIELEIIPERAVTTEWLSCDTHERSLCLGTLRLRLEEGGEVNPEVFQVRADGTPFKPQKSSVTDLAAGKPYIFVLDPHTRIKASPSPLRPVLLQGLFGILRLS